MWCFITNNESQDYHKEDGLCQRYKNITCVSVDELSRKHIFSNSDLIKLEWPSEVASIAQASIALSAVEKSTLISSDFLSSNAVPFEELISFSLSEELFPETFSSLFNLETAVVKTIHAPRTESVCLNKSCVTFLISGSED
jgi:hypothetical protein